MKNEQRRACKCGNVDFIEVTKIEAAFNLREKEIWNLKCSKCGGKNATSVISNSPEIDKELLQIWTDNLEYLFCQQDEELSLAQYSDNIDLYIEFIDDDSVPLEKKKVLIEALCVMIYDRSKKTNSDEDKKIVNKISSELKKRENQVISAQNWIMDYIKKVSFPIIGIQYFKESPNPNSINEQVMNTETEKDTIWNKIKQFWK
nr:hypothetical protein [uncultured Psychroserpens sp.]